MGTFYAIAKAGIKPSDLVFLIEKNKAAAEQRIREAREKAGLTKELEKQLADEFRAEAYPSDPAEAAKIPFRFKDGVRKLYDPVRPNIVFVTDADKAFTRKWLDAHGFSGTKLVAREDLPKSLETGAELVKPAPHSLLIALREAFKPEKLYKGVAGPRRFFVVGDSVKDIEAGRALEKALSKMLKGSEVNVRNVLLLSGKTKPEIKAVEKIAPHYVFEHFGEFAEHLHNPRKLKEHIVGGGKLVIGEAAARRLKL